jgi:hypothetical protein
VLRPRPPNGVPSKRVGEKVLVYAGGAEARGLSGQLKKKVDVEASGLDL